MSYDDLNINFTTLTIKIIDRLYNDIKTAEIDELTAQQCASLATTHPDYGTLASKILISNCHKNTNDNFLKVCEHIVFLNSSPLKDIKTLNFPNSQFSITEFISFSATMIFFLLISKTE